MALGTAVHVFFAACMLYAFKDHPDRPPILPQARVIYMMMSHVFHTYAALAIAANLSPYQHTAKVHGYTSQLCSAYSTHLAGLVGVLQQQDEHAAEREGAGMSAQAAVEPLVPSELGSQHCETAFSQGRSADGMHTGMQHSTDIHVILMPSA
jgi:hypothetical protein